MLMDKTKHSPPASLKLFLTSVVANFEQCEGVCLHDRLIRPEHPRGSARHSARGLVPFHAGLGVLPQNANVIDGCTDKLRVGESL